LTTVSGAPLTLFVAGSYTYSSASPGVLTYSLVPSACIPCVKLTFGITNFLSQPPLEVSVNAETPTPRSTTRRLPLASNVMPRGRVRLEKRTRAVKPGATVTGALNGAPGGWICAAAPMKNASARISIVRSDDVACRSLFAFKAARNIVQ
jgi:hypothetical protein